MKKILIRILIGLGVLMAVFALIVGVFIYKVKYGLPFYDSTPPEITETFQSTAVLVFSKTNGFRHEEGIKGGITAFDALGQKNDWSMYHTENGAIFNDAQLAFFDVVIYNNVTGGVLTEDQQAAFEKYMENGGGWIGIHGAGDDSHHWDWYRESFLGTLFSHHTMEPGIQEARFYKVDTLNPATKNVPDEWMHTDEWYVFYDNPQEKGASVLFQVDESTYNPSGNFAFIDDKGFGMGDEHPIVWTKCVGEGRAFYSALGHTGEAFETENYRLILEGAIKWAAGLEGECL
jgi:type 1 glutamine amidotransferase